MAKADPHRLNDFELAEALSSLGVDVTGWYRRSFPPEEVGGKQWTQGWCIGRWRLIPGGRKAYPNFGTPLSRGQSWLEELDGPLSYYVENLEELANLLHELLGAE